MSLKMAKSLFILFSPSFRRIRFFHTSSLVYFTAFLKHRFHFFSLAACLLSAPLTYIRLRQEIQQKELPGGKNLPPGSSFSLKVFAIFTGNRGQAPSKEHTSDKQQCIDSYVRPYGSKGFVNGQNSLLNLLISEHR